MVVLHHKVNEEDSISTINMTHPPDVTYSQSLANGYGKSLLQETVVEETASEQGDAQDLSFPASPEPEETRKLAKQRASSKPEESQASANGASSLRPEDIHASTLSASLAQTFPDSSEDTLSLAGSIVSERSGWSSDRSVLGQETGGSRRSRQRTIRDRSNTWSHTSTSLRAARRSGSLPPMDCAVTPVPRLSMDRGDSPLPVTPTCITPFRTKKLPVCSEHRMSTSPRLPPIGCLNDFHWRNLPKNSPRELPRDVTPIDPALIDGADRTDVRMMGMRRNAIMTPQPPKSPGGDA